ncbi:MAG: glycosyltransferase family 4 protein [Flammeovirgaceae bacterium]|nr:glycosyltransferase family 4 protein [Flammeovirgaceae bacterium]
MKKILFVVPHRINRAPNQRFRFEQYISFLAENGFECTVSPLVVTAEEDKQFYQGSRLNKVVLGIKLALRRLADTLRSNQFDVIYIAREAFFTGSIFFEKRLKKSKAKIVYDFDDAIWLDVVSVNNRFFSWLKDASKTARIIQLSHKIFAGNQYLADYAKNHNSDVVIIPTTIDTQAYRPAYRIDKDRITIGWSGSVSTIEHFQFAIPALRLLKKKYGNKIEIKVIGDGNFKNEELGIRGMPWRADTELHDLQSIDIGMMPLPDDEWTWGKCGLKGLQYMALEIPTIMSAVGVNKEIIQHRRNGYLATTTEEWVLIISDLIENPSLRIAIGQEGRKTVVEKYSVVSQQQVYLDQFRSLVNS